MFAGTVTSTSTQTVTITFSGGTPGTIRADGQEFSATAGSWALDAWGDIDAPSGTSPRGRPWPPPDRGELYFGFARNAGTAVGGSTSGYVYTVDGHGNGVPWNVSCTSATQTPAWADSGQQIGVMVLMKETGASFTAPPNRPRGRAVNRTPAGLIYA